MRAAIVGAGGIARVHARIIRELGGKLVGVCGRTLPSSSAFGGAPAYDDLTAMLRGEKPEVLHVCSPHHLHAEHSIAGFTAGAHVLCEKPMATSLDDCRRMIDAADHARRTGAIAYAYRGYPIVEVLRHRVATGAFGALRRISGCYLSQDVLDPEKYAWMFTPGSSGKSYALMDFGVHWLNLVEYVTGQRIVELTAQFSTHIPERIWRGGAGEGPRPPRERVRVTLEEQADLLIRLDNGAAGAATISGVAPGHPNTIVLSVDGPACGFDWNQEQPNAFRVRSAAGTTVHQRSPDDLPADRKWMSSLPPGHAEGYVDAFRNIVLQAWSAMRSETVVFPTFADGLRGIELVEAAVRSAATRQPSRTH